MELFIILGVCYVIYKLLSNSKSKSTYKSQNAVKMSSPKVTRSVSSNNLSDDKNDDLVTFTISFGHEEEKSTNSTVGRWIPANESIDILGKECKGNFYYGGVLKAVDTDRSYYGNQETEASLVDDTLKIELADSFFSDDSLGYWPKFISLSPKARGAYLDWLSSTRTHPETPVGYVFIYFYGIERRVTYDAIKYDVSDTEYSSLYHEVIRLKDIYGDSRSFFNYASRLIEFMCLQRPELCKLDSSNLSYANDSLLFKYELANVVSSGKPISAQLALSWIKYYPEYRFKTPARRCDKEFSELFKLRYKEKYGEGFIVKPNKTKLNISYRPASSTLNTINFNQSDLPDPSMLKGPTNKLVAIADLCSIELEAYSRYLGKKDSKSSDIEAVLLLPDELLERSSLSVITNFKNWANSIIDGNSGLVSVSDFWKKIDNRVPDKLNKKEIELIQKITSKSGFGIAPDPRYHHAKPDIEGKLVLFREGHGDYFQPTKSFNEVGMTLRLGAMVAGIDSDVDGNEIAVLRKIIEHDIKLSPVEKNSLKAYLTWRLNSPANMNGLKARLGSLDEQTKSLISHILISVALADGKIEPNEIKQLEKLYTVLGLDKALVTSDIHNISSSRIITNPATPTEKSTSPNNSFVLDEELLALHELETDAAQSMLGAIFVEEEIVQEEDAPSPPPSNLIGLDTKHTNLYQTLIAKDMWSRNEVMEFCQTLGLMIDGAIETINDWSYDIADAPVLDDNDYIYVDLEIVEELKG